MDYLDIMIGAAQASPPELLTYAERDTSFLPIVIRHEHSQYRLGPKVFSPTEYSTTNTLEAPQAKVEKPFAVNDCVTMCQKVLGLKINEIAKLVGVSRATLDLHRKGANVKNMSEYQNLHDFVSSVEKQYGTAIKGCMRNVLINRKTLLQHLMLNRDALFATESIMAEVASKQLNITVTKTEIDEAKANIRLSGIGRMA